jgi:hypothetical protein
MSGFLSFFEFRLQVGPGRLDLREISRDCVKIIRAEALYRLRRLYANTVADTETPNYLVRAIPPQSTTTSEFP